MEIKNWLPESEFIYSWLTPTTFLVTHAFRSFCVKQLMGGGKSQIVHLLGFWLNALFLYLDCIAVLMINKDDTIETEDFNYF